MTTAEVFVDAVPLDDELLGVRRRTAQVTAAVVVSGLAAVAALAAAESQLALLPVAFILGWLNLVGL
jgi:hypothetical protein